MTLKIPSTHVLWCAKIILWIIIHILFFHKKMTFFQSLKPVICRVWTSWGVLCLQGKPEPVGEDSAWRGGGRSAQPALCFGPRQGGQLTTKGFLTHQRSTTWILPRISHFVWGKNPRPVLAGDRSAKSNLTLKLTQLPHWVTEVSTLTVSPIPETDRQLMGKDFNPSPCVHSAWEFIW